MRSSVAKERSAVPEVDAVNDVIRVYIERQEVSGAVTAVVLPDRIAHLGAVGNADIERNMPMAADTMFWIASMTKPVIAAAVMMVKDDGKIAFDDAVERYIPEFKNIKAVDGTYRRLTIRQLLTHTSGLAEATADENSKAMTLADIIPRYTSKALLYEPGSKWQYCQSCINTLGRIVEIVSGKPLPDFIAERIFKPLGMNDTGFYPDGRQQLRIAKPYANVQGRLVPAEVAGIYHPKLPHFPAANGGLYSTAADYAQFCRMLINRGTLDGKHYLDEKTIEEMSSVQTGGLKTGFTEGNAWGLGVCVVRKPQGVTAVLSTGSYGHGGAYGTQAWIDPVKRIAYILLVQRSNFPNADASDLRKEFQAAAYAAVLRQG
ncbi:MAG: beta-lactamase family protein [Spirochaetes bacterium]|nr:beta-lactamase family protein [Spirochaetota bacterium]